jgi:hypothetical protein
MFTLKRQRLQKARYALPSGLKKSEPGEFSAKSRRLAGAPISNATVRELCKAGCL